jgi:hypothetical protein
MNSQSDLSGGHLLPLVTIGIPVYNGQLYLAEALDSAQAQDYPNLEILVSDNASTDDTEAMVRARAAVDPRIRSLRHAENIGPVANFRVVLDEARGTYVTWLAHDDLLSDRAYVRTVVAFLESHPETVCCASSLLLIGHDESTGHVVRDLAELRPELAWPDARKSLFRWPQTNASYAVYGMFRRDVLSQAFRYQPRRLVVWWVTDIMSSLAMHGRVVALDAPLRSYRLTKGSEGDRMRQSLSGFAFLLNGLRVKLVLLARACTISAPMAERLSLISVTVANLARANFGRPSDYPSLIAELERELIILRAAAAKREALIRLLQEEIGKRQARISAFDGAAPPMDDEPEIEPFPRATATDAGRHQSDARSRWGRFLGFFSPPPAWQVDLFNTLREDVGLARTLCEHRLDMIERLNAKAALLLTQIHGQTP